MICAPFSGQISLDCFPGRVGEVPLGYNHFRNGPVRSITTASHTTAPIEWKIESAANIVVGIIGSWLAVSFRSMKENLLHTIGFR